MRLCFSFPHTDIDSKNHSIVLILYSYDCPLHQRVVEAFAGFLMEECAVTVTLDIMEEADIAERGIDDWLVDRLQEADYILVICSLGARLRCSKKHVRFKHDGQHILPDYFAVAVDYVAEKMRVERQKGLGLNKFIACYMEYSTRSDIPPQLETAKQFQLMRDIHSLHIYLNTHGPDSEKSESGSNQGDCDNCYYETETGALLKATIEQTCHFMKENPSWMADRLEHTVPPSLFGGKGGKSRKKRHNSVEQPLLFLTTSPLNDGGDGEEPAFGLGRKLNKETENSGYLLSHSSAINQSNSSLNPNCDTYPATSSRTWKQKLNNSGICQNRQNSLPSSLTSSGLITSQTDHGKSVGMISKSMDSFSLVHHNLMTDHDGVPCLYCDSHHMDGRPECRHLQGLPTSIPHQASQESLINNSLLTSKKYDLGSHSHTVLHAEVHQEWGTPLRNRHHNEKSNTFDGGVRPPSSNYEVDLPPPTAFQSLPPHCRAPMSLDDWNRKDGILHRWQSGIQKSPQITHKHLTSDSCIHNRRLSLTSVFTDDSTGSVSDCDSLERDLRSIQNISSFHDFVNSSNFICPPPAIKSSYDLSHFIPSSVSPLQCPSTGLSSGSKSKSSDFFKVTGADIELTLMKSTPIV